MRHGDSNIYSGAELKKAVVRISGPKSATSTPFKPRETNPLSHMDSFHILHKVPMGDSPYTRAKHVQLVEKDPNKAISLFWSAINSGDRVDSALKDMAVVMKQVNRAEEAVEAIKSFRHLCSYEAQEALDNVLLDLYKRCGRTDEQIELLQYKLKLIEEGQAFGGRRTKIARSQGKKFHVSIDQEKSRLLGNLAWAYIQKDDYQTAEALYRRALSIEPDKNKQCNLAICLIKTGRVAEAKFLLQGIVFSVLEKNPTDSYIKSYERACEMLVEIESQSAPIVDKEGRQADVAEELNTIRPFESPIPARNSCTVVSPNHILDRSATARRKWADHPEQKHAAKLNNLSSTSRKFASPLVFNNDEKTWAGATGDEENVEALESNLIAWEKMWTPISKHSIPSGTLNEWSESRDNGNVSPGENFNTNINQYTPTCLLVQSPHHPGGYLLKQENESVGTPQYLFTPSPVSDATYHKKRLNSNTLFSTGAEWTPSARRSLSFGKQELATDRDPLLIKTVGISNSDYLPLQATGSGSSFGMDMKPKKQGNRFPSQRSWGDGNAFPNENLNTNIIRYSPCPPVQSLYNNDCLRKQKLDMVDLEGPCGTPPYVTPSSVSDAADHKKTLNTPFSTRFEWISSALGSLSFEKQDQLEGRTAAMLPSQATESGIGMDVKLKKHQGNRLRVFQEITLPDSPRA